jgi:metal-responsive CopG/Arc/MetJ family transcriptional regulator
MGGMARAPKKPSRRLAAKLRGQRYPLSITLPPDLVAELDEVAGQEDRSRIKIIEIACRQYVQSYRRKASPP